MIEWIKENWTDLLTIYGGLIEWIKENWTDLLAIYGGLVAVCTAIVKLTPSKKDDTIFGKIISIIDLFSTAFTKSDKEKLEK